MRKRNTPSIPLREFWLAGIKVSKMLLFEVNDATSLPKAILLAGFTIWTTGVRTLF